MKQLTALLICLMFIQYKCADSSTEDEDEEEDDPSEKPTTVDEYMNNPENVESIKDLPANITSKTQEISNKQFTLMSVSKPKIRDKRIVFKARNVLFGDFSYLPQVNLWLLLMKIVLNLNSNGRRQRRRLNSETEDVPCKNNENVPNRVVTSNEKNLVDFVCESSKDTDKTDLDDYKITIEEVGGEKPGDNFADMNLMDASENLQSEDDIKKNLLTYSVYDFEIGNDSVIMTGSGNDLNFLANQEFDVNFTVPESTAQCNFNENGYVKCDLNSGLSRAKLKERGINFTRILYIKNDQIWNPKSRRLQSSDIKTLTLGTNSLNVNYTGQGDQILRGSDKSSGLSGGAIAGIVIACAAVLIGGILAALLCRKTTTSTALYTTGTQDNLAIEQKPVYY